MSNGSASATRTMWPGRRLLPLEQLSTPELRRGATDHRAPRLAKWFRGAFVRRLQAIRNKRMNRLNERIHAAGLTGSIEHLRAGGWIK